MAYNIQIWHYRHVRRERLQRIYQKDEDKKAINGLVRLSKYSKYTYSQWNKPNQ